MKKKILIFILAIFSFNALAQGLEVTYPQVMGIRPTRASPSLYASYLFYFGITIAGIVAFVSLVFSGFQYLTSSGEPEIKKRAKERIFAAFLGIIILAFGLVIIRTLRTELTFMPEVTLPTINVPPELTIESDPSRDLIHYIRKTALDMERSILELQSINFQTFKSLLEDCTCGNAKASCDFANFACPGITCFGDPCPERDKIRNYQINIELKVEEVLLYNRLLQDVRENLKPEILGKEPTSEMKAKIDGLKKIIKEIDDLIKPLKERVKELTNIAQECQNPARECQAQCESSSGNCYCEPKDKKLCPMDKFESQVSSINSEILSKIQGKLALIIAYPL